MSNQESSRIRRIVGWGILGLIILIGVSIVLSLYFGPRTTAFFHFPFGWFGAIFLIFIIFWIARWFFWPWRGKYYSHGYTSAEHILKERYAKGELTKEQFDQMMRDIKDGK